MERNPVKALQGLLGMLLLSGCVTSGFELGASAALFTPQFKGNATIDSFGGPDIDINNTLNLDDREYDPMVRVDLGAVGFGISATAFQTEVTGTGLLTADLGGITAGTVVDSKLDFTSVKANLTIDVINFAGFRLAPGIGGEYFSIRLEVEDQLSILQETVNEATPVPLVFVELDWDPPWIPLAIETEIGAIWGDYGPISGLVADAEARVHFDVVGPLSLFAGYRYLTFEVDAEDGGNDITGDLTMDGYMVGARIRF